MTPQLSITAIFGMSSFAGLGVIFGVVVLAALLAALPAGKRRRAILPMALFSIHLVLLVVSWIIPATAVAARPVAVLSVFSLLLGTSRAAFLLLTDGILEARLRRPIPKIFRDVLQAVVFTSVVFITLRDAGVEPGSLLTTSALLTAVIGLSLQDTLGNLFAGLSIQVQRPFTVGDWVQLDSEAKLVGEVIEINWRATKVVTNDHMEVIVPNSLLARSPIRNFSQPTRVARRVIEVSCAYEVAPRRVRETILTALEGVAGVLVEPPPQVLAQSFGQSGIDYAIRYFTTDFARRDATDSLVRERIWYALRRARIDIPYPMRDVHLHQVSADDKQRLILARRSEIARRLHTVDFLDVLPQETILKLAGLVESREYAAGELVVRQGDAGEEMFLIVRGEVSVLVGRDGGSTAEMARLREGSFFGEMSLMTGERRVATVQVVSDSELLAIGKEAFISALGTSPEVAAQVTHAIAARQEQLETHLAERAARTKEEVISERAGALLERMRKFFGT